MSSLAQFTGVDSSHLKSFDQDDRSFWLHPDVIPAWQQLCREAHAQGFQPHIASAHRSFDRQLGIWNDKASGKRPVLDAEETPIDISVLSNEQLLFAILRWSALPGLSRHHWGSEIDIYDTSTMSPDYRLQLTVAETQAEGIFAPFYQWLNQRFKDETVVCGFTRPYMTDSLAVAPEPWHLSYQKVADQYQNTVTKADLKQFLAHQNIALKRELLTHFDAIYSRDFDGEEPCR